jgi:hypothetical protein
MLSTKLGTAVLTALVVGAGGAVAVATGTIAGGGGAVKACVRASDGVIHVPAKGKKCKPHERTITINGLKVVTVTGPAGPTGPAGATGPKGDTGQPGVPPASPPAPYSLGGDTMAMRIDGGPNVAVSSLAGCDQPVLGAAPRDCIVTISGVSSDVVSWVHGALAGAAPRHNVDLIEVNGALAPVRGIHLDQAVISDVRFDDLDAAGPVSWTMSVTLTPLTISRLTSPTLGSNATVTGQLASNFRVQVTGLTTTAITGVRHLHVSIPASGAPVVDPVVLVSGPSGTTLSDLQGWSDDAQHGNPDSRDTTISLLNPSLTQTNLTFTLPAAHPVGLLTPFSPRTIPIASSSFNVG